MTITDPGPHPDLVLTDEVARIYRRERAYSSQRARASRALAPEWGQ